MTTSSFFFFSTLLLLGYLLGSIPSGFLIGKWVSGIDLRELGSGSTGATNVLRHVGKKPALAVFVFDVGKGTFAVLLAKTLVQSNEIEVVTGLAALAGHIWPIWLKGKGGKAVATGLGILLGIAWPVGIACFCVFLTVLSFSKIVSLSSIIAAISLPLLMLLHFESTKFSTSYITLALGAMAIVLWRHRSNFKRILAGTEPRIGQT